MKSWHKCVLVVILLALIAITNGKRKELDSRRYCGKNLVKVLSHVCRGEYYYRHNRDVDEIKDRIRRSIIDECCRSVCTMKILKTYCHSDINSYNERKDEDKSYKDSRKNLPSNDISRGMDYMQADEPQEEMFSATTQSDIKEKKDVPVHKHLGSYKDQDLSKSNFVWRNEFYDDNSRTISNYVT